MYPVDLFNRQRDKEGENSGDKELDLFRLGAGRRRDQWSNKAWRCGGGGATVRGSEGSVSNVQISLLLRARNLYYETTCLSPRWSVHTAKLVGRTDG